MTNTSNQKFIEEFKERTHGYQTFNKRVTGAHNRRVEIKDALNEIHKFIQGKVMAKSTSSLVRTQVVLPYEKDNYRAGKAEKKVTINHKGIGTINYALPGQTGYGLNQTFSDEMDSEELLVVMSTPSIRDAIKADLLSQNSYKVLKYFNDVCNTETELIQLKSVGDKYGSQIELSFDEPQEIVRMEVDYASDSENGSHEVKRINFQAHKVRIDHSEQIIFVKSGLTEEVEEVLEMKFDEIETAMILMQIPDEMDNVLTKIEVELQKDFDEVQKLIETVKDKLCVYAAVAELKE